MVWTPNSEEPIYPGDVLTINGQRLTVCESKRTAGMLCLEDEKGNTYQWPDEPCELTRPVKP